MKFLKTIPPVPPYLHLGSIRLAAPVSSARAGKEHREIDNQWRQISAEVVRDRKNVLQITRRIDERESDPSYTDAPYEVFYTVRDDGRGEAVIDYYF